MVLNYILVACPWSFQKHLIIHPKILDHGNCRNSTFWGAKSVKRFNWKEISKTVDCQLQSHWGETHEWIVQLFKNSLPRKQIFQSLCFCKPSIFISTLCGVEAERSVGALLLKPKTLTKVFYMLKSTELIARTNFACQVRRKKMISEITNWRAIDWFKHKRRQTFDLTFVFRRFWFPQDQTSVFVYVCPARDRRFFLIFTLTTRDIDECCYSYGVHTQQ